MNPLVMNFFARLDYCVVRISIVNDRNQLPCFVFLVLVQYIFALLVPPLLKKLLQVFVENNYSLLVLIHLSSQNIRNFCNFVYPIIFLLFKLFFIIFHFFPLSPKPFH